MKDFFRTTLAVVVGIFITSIIMSIFMMIGFGIIASITDDDVEIEPKTILHLKLNTPITDRNTESLPSLSNIQNFDNLETTGLNVIIKNIKKAKNDDNVKGIYLDLTSINAGISTIEEIRNALIDFKESEKFIVSHANVYSQLTYYLASVSDNIYMTPTGGFTLIGLSSQVMYFKDAFEKLGIEPQVIRHGKFKSAVEPFMQNTMSEANREQISTYMGSIWNNMLEKIGKQRNISVDELNRYADEMLIVNDSDCIEYKLIDELKYKDELIAELKKLSKIEEDDDLETVSLNSYNKVKVKNDNKERKVIKDRIAVIYATGSIEMGEGDDLTIGSERLSKAIKKARKNKYVKAIVLRINSPGGSALASEIILREALLAQKEKPLIVSMGDLAASGGYYIACAADTIIAQPNTITGSIGVFGLMFQAQTLMNDKLGIHVETVKTNKHSDIGSQFRALTTEERNVIQKSIEDIYTTFITHVANARNMSIADVDSIGQGRIWSGLNALEIGLVDKIGGLDDAIEIAANKAGLDKYRILELPTVKDPFEEFMEAFTKNMSAKIISKHMGNNYKYIQWINEIEKMQGIQCRMLYNLDIH